MEYITKYIKGKPVDIPTTEVANFMAKLGIPEDEAIVLWLTDNDYLDNEEVNRLTQLAKENKTNLRADTGERKKREVQQRENPNKEMLIKVLSATLNNIGATNVKITNISKLIEFEMNGNNYKLDLIQKRQPKK